MRNDVLTALAMITVGLLAAVPSTATEAIFDSMGAPGSNFSEVYAYPNPAKQTSAVTFHAGIEQAAGVEFTVYDTTGRRIHEAQVSGDPASIGGSHGYEYKWNFGSIASGVYFVVAKANLNGGSHTTRRTKVVVVQ